MFLDRLVRFLLPRQGQFFTMLEGIGDKIAEAAALFGTLESTTGHPQFEALAVNLKTIEKAADEFERQIHQELDRTFVTPIDREDLAALAKALDNVVDGMEHAATFAALYQFDKLTEPMNEMVRLTVRAATELAGAVKFLRRFGNPEAINTQAAAVYILESEGDSVYRKAVAGLFTDGLPPADLVRQKDMLFALEGGLDQCEDAMDVIRSVMVKNG
jgi:predicted phosphate transport protein (TIGR00153 family)